MTLVEHLQELRSRLFKALVVIAVGGVVGYVFFHQIFGVIVHPYCVGVPVRERALGGACRFVYSGPLDGLTVRVKVGLTVGVVLASPVWLYQLWAFITPALHRHERRWAVVFVTSAVLLFASGCALAYYILPKALHFLGGVGGSQLVNLPDITRYLSILQALLLVFGAAFEMPLVLVMLNLTGVLSAARMRHWWRWAVLLIFVFAGVAVPTGDAFTMLALAVPMTALYGLSVLVATLHDRRHPRDPYAGLDPDQPSELPTFTDA
jgi:sec-independent protein translocase protein TatC